MLDFSSLDIMNIDLSNTYVEGRSEITEGWHKVYISNISEVSTTKSGTAEGVQVEFTISTDDKNSAGLTFRRWFCVRALDPKLVWSQKAFEGIVVRIAQCVGVPRVVNIESDLANKPFYAYITAKEETFSSVDKVTGAVVQNKAIRNDFGRGKVTEQILSCKEYSERNTDRAFASSFTKAE